MDYMTAIVLIFELSISVVCSVLEASRLEPAAESLLIAVNRIMKSLDGFKSSLKQSPCFGKYYNMDQLFVGCTIEFLEFKALDDILISMRTIRSSSFDATEVIFCNLSLRPVRVTGEEANKAISSSGDFLKRIRMLRNLTEDFNGKMYTKAVLNLWKTNSSNTMMSNFPASDSPFHYL